MRINQKLFIILITLFICQNPLAAFSNYNTIAIDTIPEAVQAYKGNRIMVKSIKVNKRKGKSVKISYNLVNTGRNKIKLGKKRVVPSDLIVEFDGSLEKNELAAAKASIIESIKKQDISIRPGQLIMGEKLKFENHPIPPSDRIVETENINETPKIETVEEVVEVPAIEMPVEEVVEVPAIETPVEEVVEVPAIETPVEEVVEVPTIESPDEEVVEVPAIETPVEEVVEVPAIESPVEEVVEVPAIETPGEEVVEVPAIEMPVEEVVEVLAIEAPVEEVVEVPAIESPVEEIVEVPAIESPIEEIVEVPAIESPIEEVVEVPTIESPVEEVVEVPAIEAPIEEVVEVPAIETPVEEVVEVPAIEAPIEEVVEVPAETINSNPKERQCPDLAVVNVEIAKKNKRNVTLKYTVTNMGNIPIALLGDTKKEEDNISIQVYFTRSEKLTRGAIPVKSVFIKKGLKGKGLLEPNATYSGKIKIETSKMTKFTPVLAFSIDPNQDTPECTRTNNVSFVNITENAAPKSDEPLPIEPLEAKEDEVIGSRN